VIVLALSYAATFAWMLLVTSTPAPEPAIPTPPPTASAAESAATCAVIDSVPVAVWVSVPGAFAVEPSM
jgi:hypothetical protein